MNPTSTSAPASNRPHYWAFISYSHQDNLRARGDGGENHIQWANWLHESLETFRVPEAYRGHVTRTGEPMPERFFPTFRDETELPTSHDLGGQIRDALERSRFLIVIASPRSARSRYVNEEVRYFRQLGRGDRILVLIVDGEPNVRLTRKAGWTEDDECFCSALVCPLDANGKVDEARLLAEEPIAADVRLKEVDPARELHASECEHPDRRAQLDFVKLKLIAGLMGVGLDELVQRDKVRELDEAARRARTLRRWLTAVGVLALAALAGGYIAYEQLHRAQIAERATAEQSARRQQLLEEAARSDRVVAQDKLKGGEEQAALAHLARAISYDPQSTLTAEIGVEALSAWQHPPPLMGLSGHEGMVHSAEFSADGAHIVTASQDETARVWDAITGQLVTTLSGHQASVVEARFSPDGTRVVTASEDKTARVWEATTGKLIATLSGHEGALLGARFSPDGTRIVTASRDKTARIWEAATGKLITILSGHQGGVLEAQFSPDGARIVTASVDTTARIWDAMTGQLVTTLLGHKNVVSSAQFSPDGAHIVTASEDGTARVWNAATGQLGAALSGHQYHVKSANFSPDGVRIVTASLDDTARVWEAITGQLIATLSGHQSSVMGARFSPDGALIITASPDHTARVWEAATGQLIATLSGYEDGVQAAQFSPDGTRIVTAGDTPLIWEGRTGKLVAILPDNRSVVNSAQFSPDGTRIVTERSHISAQVWEATTGKLVATLSHREGSLTDVQFSPDGARLVTASRDNTAQIWDAATGRPVATLTGHANLVTSARFSRDGARIVTASADMTARIWNAATGKLVTTLPGHQHTVMEAQFSTDGAWIVTASLDRTARVWNAATGKLAATLSGHEDGVMGAKFSPDGAHIATDSGGKTRIWDANTNQLVTILFDPLDYSVSRDSQFSPDGTRIVTVSASVRVWNVTTGKQAAIFSDSAGGWNARFSPDGALVVAALENHTARVWDSITGHPVAVLTGHQDRVWSAQFSPDGARIVTASEDKTARVWTMIPPQAGPPPGWFRDFLHLMGRKRLNTDGVLEDIRVDDCVALRKKLRAVLHAEVGKKTPYLEVLRHFVKE